MKNQLFFLIVSVFSLLNAADDIYPYLQSPTASSIYICWETTSEDDESIVQYKLPAGIVQTESGEFEELTSGNSWHWVKLENLLSDTLYEYRVYTTNTSSQWFRFRTLPEEGENTKSGHLRFIVRSDNQSNHETGTFIVNSMHQKLTSIFGSDLEDHISFIFNAGDIVGNGWDITAYQREYFEPLQPFSPFIPSMISIGNHEAESDYFYQYMKYEDFAGPEGEQYYHFRVGRVLLVALNSNPAYRNETQLDWLDELLTNAQTDESIDHIFAFSHHPPVSSVWNPGTTPYMRDGVVPILQKYRKVRYLINGHTHAYERGATVDGTLGLMIAGGSGGSLDRWSHNHWHNHDEHHKAYDHYHYVLFDIDLLNQTFSFKTYSLGHTDVPLDNAIIDSGFVDTAADTLLDTPQIVAAPDSVTLPYTLEAEVWESDYGTLSSQFQVAYNPGSFAEPLVSKKQDFEDYFLDSGAPDYTPIDQNAGIELNRFEVTGEMIPFEGQYKWRMRYRDHNLNWSPWSDDGMLNIFNTGIELPRQYSKALLFDGANAHVAITDDLNLAKLPTLKMTVETWVRLKSHHTWGGYIGAIEDNGSYEKGWVLGNQQQEFSFALATEGADDGNGFMTYLKSGETFEYNKWYHVAATYDGAVMRLYVDGRLTNFSTEQSGNILYDMDSFFDIGVYHDDNEFFVLDGELDETRLWLTNLSQTTLQEWMHGEVNQTHPNFVHLISNWEFNSLSRDTVPDGQNQNDGRLMNANITANVASSAPLGQLTRRVNTQEPVVLGEPGTGLNITILSSPGASHYLGGYETTENDQVDYESFPEDVRFRIKKIWGIYEHGTVTSNLTIEYANIHFLPSLDSLTFLKRTNAESPWLDITAQGEHDMQNRTFSLGNQSVYGEYSIGYYAPDFTGIKPERTAETFTLLKNYPNPFNPGTTISFSLAKATNINLAIFDVTGRKVRTLVRKAYDAGTHRVAWDGRNDNGVSLASGVYFCRIGSASSFKTIKMLMVR
jgi:hypothetical protein